MWWSVTQPSINFDGLHSSDRTVWTPVCDCHSPSVCGRADNLSRSIKLQKDAKRQGAPSLYYAGECAGGSEVTSGLAWAISCADKVDVIIYV